MTENAEYMTITRLAIKRINAGAVSATFGRGIHACKYNALAELLGFQSVSIVKCDNLIPPTRKYNINS